MGKRAIIGKPAWELCQLLLRAASRRCASIQFAAAMAAAAAAAAAASRADRLDTSIHRLYRWREGGEKGEGEATTKSAMTARDGRTHELLQCAASLGIRDASCLSFGDGCASQRKSRPSRRPPPGKTPTAAAVTTSAVAASHRPTKGSKKCARLQDATGLSWFFVRRDKKCHAPLACLLA